ncbi:phospholipase A2 inhibitor and Ly6/PLAUR domain-containing protein-like isoform X2 [Pseudophryne corroboree]|uniref:phospholipase A2 inhibitor and Ly6/PLAUR domain-containing protein-like isoform X2 n=1 Tax=Pseudophryne corroboree TaxID=495146 RepID=UPI0030812623
MRMSLVGFLFVLSALTSTGFSLSCHWCLLSEYTSCPERTMQCLSADYACGVSRTTTLLNGIVYYQIFDFSCVPKTQCNTQGSFSFPYGKIKRNTYCCYTDNCIAPEPPFIEAGSSNSLMVPTSGKLQDSFAMETANEVKGPSGLDLTGPADNFEPNGLTCPACVSDSDWCDPNYSIQCIGKENMCIFEVTKIYAPEEKTAAIRGCATESLCHLSNSGGIVTMGTLKILHSASCTPATPANDRRIEL